MQRSIAPTIKRFILRSNWIEQLVKRSKDMDSHPQRLTGELAILYLAISLEQTIEELCLKLCCGSSYSDGTLPTLTVKSKSIDQAADQMKNVGRKHNRSLKYLKWLKATDIKENIQFLVDQSDPVYGVLSKHGDTFETIRIIRNHVAHRSRSSLSEYRKLVHKIYGPLSKAIEPGAFLMSERRSVPSQILKIIISSRVLIRELAQE